MAANLEKLVEDLSALTVIEAADLAKLLETKWGVSAAAPVAAAGAVAAAPAEEKPAEAPPAETPPAETPAAGEDAKPIPFEEPTSEETKPELEIEPVPAQE